MPDQNDNGYPIETGRWRREIENRIGRLERTLAAIEERLAHGISGGALRGIQDNRTEIDRLRNRVDDLSKQSNRFEGGSAVIYVIVTMIGGALGWFLSHLGVGK